MSTYKEQKANRKIYVLLKDCEVIGTARNLKDLCRVSDDIKYNTVNKKTNYPISYKDYKIYQTTPI
jgi:hypothetical protein